MALLFFGIVVFCRVFCWKRCCLATQTHHSVLVRYFICRSTRSVLFLWQKPIVGKKVGHSWREIYFLMPRTCARALESCVIFRILGSNGILDLIGRRNEPANDSIQSDSFILYAAAAVGITSNCVDRQLFWLVPWGPNQSHTHRTTDRNHKMTAVQCCDCQTEPCAR